MISGFFFSLCVSLKWKSIWYSLNCGKMPLTKSHAVHGVRFFLSILGDENVSVSFRLAGVGANICSGLFSFLLPIRETEINFMFSWSLQVAVEKRAGAYAVFFTFVSRKIRLSFLVIPKKQIDPECDRIFVACFHCKYTYTAKVICVCNDNDIRWLICVLSGRCGRIFCFGYLKPFMVENRGLWKW